jgi:xanthine dehydrogenase accessory factor
MSAAHEWLPVLVQCLQRHAQAVRVVVAGVRGSAPRDAGTCMIVAPDGVHGTIGGGRLEWEVLSSARALMDDHRSQAGLRSFVLGPQLGQCCGGAVEIWLERYARTDLAWLSAVQQRSRSEPLALRSTWVADNTVQRSVEPMTSQAARGAHLLRSGAAVSLLEWLEPALTLYLYGAGHVGRAVLSIAAGLPWQVTCIDSRAEWLAATCVGTLEKVCTPEPVATVAQAPADSCFLVMTHSHALDYALVRAILGREPAWVGLIGSHSKSVRFRAQLRRDGVAATQVERLVCPIGIGIRDKHPTAIAVSVVAQLLQYLQTPRSTRSDSWAASPPTNSQDACAHSCSDCHTPPVSS